MNASALELSHYLNSATVAASAAQFEMDLTNNTDDVQVTPNAELTIRKQVINDNGGNASLTDFSLTSDAGTLVFDAGVTVGDTTTYTADTLFIAPGTYSMSEADVAGYTEGTWSCVDVDDNPLPMNADVFDAGSLPLEFGGIHMQATCTIINDDDAASLVVVKDVVNDNGGDAVVADFGITTSAGGLVFDAGTTVGDTTTYTATALTVDANTAFDLAEIDLAGYTEGSWSCDNGDGGTFDAGSVTLDEGEVVTCSISNDDAAASLTVVKEVLNDNGGTGVVGDFGITTTAGALIFDAGITIGDTTTYTATTLSVDANTTFGLSENDLAAYAEGNWSCTNGDGGTFDAGSVTLDEGEVVICTINNNDRGVDLSIIKMVDDATPDIGDIITFSLQIDNAGPDGATDVSVTDLLPAGFSYGATIPVAGVTETGTAPNLAWTISSIPSAGSVTIQYTATVLAP